MKVKFNYEFLERAKFINENDEIHNSLNEKDEAIINGYILELEEMLGNRYSSLEEWKLEVNELYSLPFEFIDYMISENILIIE
jgi:hypothetical protein